MAKPFHCSIVTPTKSVLADNEVTYASFEAWDGQRGVLTGQSPLLTKLGIGAVRLDFVEGGSRWFLIEEGFAQVQNDVLTLLTNAATPAESISRQDAESELAEANARVAQSGEDRELVRRDQQRALAKKSLTEVMEARGHAI